MHDYTIETDRLVLRLLRIEDAQSVYQWVSDERVAKYMVYNTYTSLEDAVDWLTRLQEPDEEYHLGFVRKKDGLLIGSGSIGPESERKDFWAFGYNFRYDCWGKGYATEAAEAMIKFVNEKFGAMKFSSSHAEPNKASGRVMEKCGLHFARYGEFKKLDGTSRMTSIEYEMEII